MIALLANGSGVLKQLDLSHPEWKTEPGRRYAFKISYAIPPTQGTLVPVEKDLPGDTGTLIPSGVNAGDPALGWDYSVVAHRNGTGGFEFVATARMFSIMSSGFTPGVGLLADLVPIL